MYSITNSDNLSICGDIETNPGPDSLE